MPKRATAPKRRRTSEPARTRSFQCPDELWSDVEALARERGLGAPAVAARLLLRSGLAVEHRARELDAARDWQIEQAWAEVQAIASGDPKFGSWTEIERAAKRARRRIRARAVALAGASSSS